MADRMLRAFGVVVALVCVTPLAWASSARGADVAQLEQRGVTRIIVKREQDLSASERSELRANADVSLVKRLSLPETEVVRAQPGQLGESLAELKHDPAVVYAEPDAPIALSSNDTYFGDLWGLDNVGQRVNGTVGSTDADIDAPQAWLTSTGAGETIAVIDTGVDFSHPDLQGQFAINPGESGGGRESNRIDDDGNGLIDDHHGWDRVESDNEPADANGHGTHVAGIIAARRDNGVGVTGVAPSARLLPLRVLDTDGRGYSSAAAEALAYAGRRGVRIVNASLGGAIRSQAVRDAIAAHPGSLYVLAAGNMGSDDDSSPYYPCALPEPNIVCVGASDSSDRPAGFSNFGARSVDLHAPGVAIRSAYRSDYAFMEGTSMATPYVAGTIALVAATNRRLDAAGLKQRVLASAEPRPSLAGLSVTGARLNAADAVAGPSDGGGPDASSPATPASSPTPPAPYPPATEPIRAVPAPVTSPAVVAPAPAPDPAAAPRASTSTPAVPPHATAPGSPALPPSRSAAAGAPVLSALRLSSRTLHGSLTVSFQLDRRADLRLMVARKVCRRGRRCAYTPARAITVAARAGVNRYVLRNRSGGRRLAAGSYRLTARASDGRRRSPSRTVGFTVS